MVLNMLQQGFVTQFVSMNHIKEVWESGLVLQLLVNLEKCRGVEFLSLEGQVHIRTRLRISQAP